MSCHIRLLSAHTILPPLSHVGTGGSTWGRAPASLSNVAFRAEPKKQCINTTLILNEKNVYKHCFCRVARRRPTKKLCLYTVLFWVDAAQHGKNVFIHSFIVYGQSCVYTQLFRLRPKCGIAQASSRLSFPALVPASFSDRLVPTSCPHRPFAWIFDHTC